MKDLLASWSLLLAAFSLKLFGIFGWFLFYLLHFERTMLKIFKLYFI